MYRQLYQMGGIGTLPMDFGQPLQVPQQPQPSFSSARNITSNPLLNYGQPQLGEGTPLTMAGGGMSRLGYEEGGMGIMGAMPQDAGMMQEGGQEQTALLTIIQLLIEQGIPPEQAEELAMQILQVFNQGGAPAVEEFANQLEQEEGMPENRTMMAGGGITGIYPRQGYFFKGVVRAVTGAVKGVAKAVKSVAKSPIGQIALAIAAPYAMSYAFGPAFATFGNATLGTFGGAALRAGISNLAIQGITTGKFNPKQALLAAAVGGALSGVSQGFGSGQTTGITPEGINVDALTNDLSSGVVNQGSSITPSLNTGTVGSQYGTTSTGVNLDAAYSDFSKAPGTVLNTASSTPTDLFDKATTSIKDFGTNLMNDPMKTIKTGIGSIYDTTTQLIKDNPYTAVGTSFLAGNQFRAPLPGEDPNEYNKLKAEHDAKVNQYYNQYSGLMNPPTFAANGGRIGFEYGSMPMGEPRKNPAGIMELDYRAKGGFVPPIGIKEKADDIPAMLSNNEFVFTANAVRNAGGGDVDRGAQRMYSLMKNLENGGRA